MRLGMGRKGWRMLEEMIGQLGKRNGLELTGKKLEEFKMVKKKISELSIAYR